MLFSSFTNSNCKKSKNYYILEHNSGSSSAAAQLFYKQKAKKFCRNKKRSASENQILKNKLDNPRSHPLEFGHWQVLGNGVLVKPLTLTQQKKVLKKKLVYNKDLNQARILGKNQTHKKNILAKKFFKMDEKNSNIVLDAPTAESPGSNSHYGEFYW